VLGTALQPDDLLQATLEVGPLQTRPAAPEVLGQVCRAGGIELAVDEMLDLVKHLFAANL
jgi:hypothetical protein